MRELCSSDPKDAALHAKRWNAVEDAEQLADRMFSEADARSCQPPLDLLERLHLQGFFVAPLPSHCGGLGVGTESGGHLPLTRILAAFGGADLALGRVYEGHVNALILIAAFGSAGQLDRASKEAHAGKLFGVWNTGEPSPMRLEPDAAGFVLRGAKTFATGAAFVQRPIVTAELGGWQMTVPRMESPGVASAIRIDRDSWQPLGMESSESLTIDFSGAHLEAEDLLGKPGDFYRDPLFRGGAIRFAAVQSGAVLRLAHLFADWLISRGRQSDPYQIARLGEVELLAQQAVLWVERAAAVAETCMANDVDEQHTKQMVRCANMTRLAIQRSAASIMAHIVPGVGAHGLLRPARFERLIRDLTMYLRQPNPDGTLVDVGNSALWEDGAAYWTESDRVPPP